jgi:hypothetical protein
MARAVILWLGLVAACGYPKLERLCTADDPPGAACIAPADAGADAACPALHAMQPHATPTVQLLIDRSASMIDNLGSTGVSKYTALARALVGTGGVVPQLQDRVYFGASVYSDDTPCPKLYSVARALNNAGAISGLVNSQSPQGSTPTAPSIDAAVSDLFSSPPGSPRLIVLATDGLPNGCGNTTTTEAESVAAAQNAFANGVRLVVLSVGDTAGTAMHFQAMANAGAGVQPGQPDAPYYPITTAQQLTAALQTVIAAPVAPSCDFRLSAAIDPAAAASGRVVLDSVPLTYGSDWSIDPDKITLHILGNACLVLKAAMNPTIDASFPCAP